MMETAAVTSHIEKQQRRQKTQTTKDNYLNKLDRATKGVLRNY